MYVFMKYNEIWKSDPELFFSLYLIVLAQGRHTKNMGKETGCDMQQTSSARLEQGTLQIHGMHNNHLATSELQTSER